MSPSLSASLSGLSCVISRINASLVFIEPNGISSDFRGNEPSRSFVALVLGVHPERSSLHSKIGAVCRWASSLSAT